MRQLRVVRFGGLVGVGGKQRALDVGFRVGRQAVGEGC